MHCLRREKLIFCSDLTSKQACLVIRCVLHNFCKSKGGRALLQGISLGYKGIVQQGKLLDGQKLSNKMTLSN
jgi:hypothetical protein